MKPQKNFLIVLLSVVVVVSAVAYGIAIFVRADGHAESLPRAASDGVSVPVALPSSAPQGVCPVQVRKVTVSGTSLSGFIAPGSAVTVLAGYYACRDPKPGDVVIYLYGGPAANDPLIKIVKGIQGDAVSFQKAGGAWNILVNGAPLVTTAGIPYAITGQVFETFSRYVNDVKGIIPPDEYLILGNLPAGSIDSTRFGFVEKRDLVGKVIIEAGPQ
jgi:signal peptidase I